MSNVLEEFNTKQQLLYSILEMKDIPEELEDAFDYFYCDPCKYHAGKAYDACDVLSCFKAWATGDLGLVASCLQEYNEEQAEGCEASEAITI